MAFLGTLESTFDGGVEFFADAFLVALDFRAGRPILGCVCGQAAADGVDTEGKKLIEGGMKGPQTEGAPRKQVPVKGFDVADVKYDAMPLGDGPVVQCFFANDAEQFIGPSAGINQTCVEIVTNARWRCSECSHGVDPFFRCQVREKDAPKIGVGRRTTL